MVMKGSPDPYLRFLPHYVILGTARLCKRYKVDWELYIGYNCLLVAQRCPDEKLAASDSSLPL